MLDNKVDHSGGVRKRGLLVEAAELELFRSLGTFSMPGRLKCQWSKVPELESFLETKIVLKLEILKTESP